MKTFINLISELTNINQQFYVHYAEGKAIVNIIQHEEVKIEIYNDEDIYINSNYYRSIDHMEIMIITINDLENKINK